MSPDPLPIERHDDPQVQAIERAAKVLGLDPKHLGVSLEQAAHYWIDFGEPQIALRVLSLATAARRGWPS